ncbi:hypothetical protein LCGC14_0761940 [marine sediment metagenome]|uniref:Uncharacterized protein n=1 Tax=marine sediment metagenome TaxID=412755 RepID=A0A0F9T7V5_9ZZZZ|nr:hypothetical protein [bacterium]
MADKIEVDLWIQADMIERFRTEFQSYNDVKFDGMDTIKVMGVDKRVCLFYRNFGGELKLPNQGYYQLNAVYQMGAN